MSRSKGSLRGITALGAATTKYDKEYNPRALECFDNNFPRRDFWIRFTCPEFHSINPATGEPYGATILIQYIPAKKLVESKSLKLYMFSFRYSVVTRGIGQVVLDDIVNLLKPKYCEVEVRTMARKGLKARTRMVYARKGSKYEKLAAARLAAFKAEQKVAPQLEEIPMEVVDFSGLTEVSASDQMVYEGLLA